MFSRASTFTHVGWRDHITEYRLLSTRRPSLCRTYTVGAFGWATVRPSTDSNLFSLYQKRRHSGVCNPFKYA
nr:MAG TPA: hypothetical protein [Caudoviricetes sp.]